MLRRLVQRLPPHTGTVALSAAVFYLLLQWSFTSLAEYDSFYHVGITRLYLEHGPIRQFPWMSTSILRDHFNDPQLLLHLLLLPLLLLRVDPVIAGKLMAALTATLLATTFYWFLAKRQVKFAVAWTLAWVVGSSYVIARLAFLKSTALFLTLLLVFLDALVERRARRLFVLSWLAVLTYQGFPLLAVLALLWFAAAAIVGEEWSFEDLRPIAAGFVAGLVVNPFFPNDLYFFHFEIVKQILLKPKELVLGAEWGTIDTTRFLAQTWLALVVLSFAEVTSSLTKAGSDALTLLVRLVTALLFFGALLSARLIEYFVPFAFLSSALMLSRAIAGGAPRMKLAWGLALFLLVPAAAFNIKEGLRISSVIAAGIGDQHFARAAEWLKANSQDGEVVVSQWDDFPMLFFHDRKNHYLFGLNVAYGAGYNEQLFQIHSVLYDGRLRDPETYLQRVDGKYLLVSHGDDAPPRRMLVEGLRKNPAFDEVMSSGGVYLFRLRAKAP